MNIRKLRLLLIIIYAVGILAHIFPETRQMVIPLTPFVLLLSGAVIFYSFELEGNEKLYVISILLYIIAFLIEAIGVKTGLPFGYYNYGNVLGIKLFDVPLIIGLNWVFVILGSISMTNLILKDRRVVPILAGAFAVVFDLLLEHTAVKLNYWTWLNGIIPFQNYLTWLLFTLMAAYILRRLNITVQSKLLNAYYYIQIVFFISLLIVFR